MTSLKKPTRLRDPAYLEWLRETGRCVICGSSAVDTHHLVTRGSGGSDHSAVPLCRVHHTEVGHIGRRRFEHKYVVDLWEVCARKLSQYIVEVAGGRG